MYYARACDSNGEDVCGGDNLLRLDGRLSLYNMHCRASKYARERQAAGYNIYRNLRDAKPMFQLIFIKVKN